MARSSCGRNWRKKVGVDVLERTLKERDREAERRSLAPHNGMFQQDLQTRRCSGSPALIGLQTSVLVASA